MHHLDWKIIFVLVLLLASIHTQVIAADGASAPDKAALVNGVLISGAEFRTELSRIARLNGGDKKSADPTGGARRKKEALENLITRELLCQEAGKAGITVPESEVTAEVDGLKKKLAGAEFEPALQRMGLSETALRSQVEKGMAIRRFIDDKFGKKVNVSDADIEYYYEDHRDEFRDNGGKPASFLPLSEVKEKIRLKLKQERIQKEFSPYLKRLRETATVEILLNGDEE